MSEETALYAIALEKWGAHAQVMMVIEEMAELTKALCDLYRKRYILEENGDCIDAVAEEVADVEIMLGQLRVIMGDEKPDAWKKVKLARLKARLEV